MKDHPLVAGAAVPHVAGVVGLRRGNSRIVIDAPVLVERSVLVVEGGCYGNGVGNLLGFRRRCRIEVECVGDVGPGDRSADREQRRRSQHHSW